MAKLSGHSSPSLAARTHGSLGRAALILVAWHVIPVLIGIGLWAFGLASIFDHHRWIPTTLVCAFALPTVFWIVARFGFWGVAASGGQGGGEEYMETFGPLGGLGLGILRWFLQLILIGGLGAACVVTFTNLRWFYLVPPPQIKALKVKVDAMPLPADWTLSSSSSGDDGSVSFYNKSMSREYDVPHTVTAADLRSWLEGPGWTTSTSHPGGPAFGAIQTVYCSTDPTTTCKAQLIPAAGQHPEYTVQATAYAGIDGAPTQVSVFAEYRQYQPPTGASAAAFARAAAEPIPSTWVQSSIDGSQSDNGEEVIRWFGVPTSFTFADLRTWFSGPAWTTATGGTRPWGPLQDVYCKPESDFCSAMTDKSTTGGRIENLLVSYHDGRVMVSLNLVR
ncbi:hypothetical protein [Nocardioides sp.]|uniref:hypothetical protein n=1 Tax=Nocardioides sp. TaxID=35761 RepID=UPI0026253FF1|nr:hypothetical protein [Nocardioides sp.]